MEAIDGLIIPGGESTTMLKLLRYDGLFDALAGEPSGAGEFRHDGHRGGAQRLRAAGGQPGGGAGAGGGVCAADGAGQAGSGVHPRAIIREVRDGVQVLAEYEATRF